MRITTIRIQPKTVWEPSKTANQGGGGGPARRSSAEIQYGTQTMVEIMHDVPSTRSVDALRTRFGGGAWRSAAVPSCGVVLAARRFACRVVRRGGDDAIFRWAGG